MIVEETYRVFNTGEIAAVEGTEPFSRLSLRILVWFVLVAINYITLELLKGVRTIQTGFGSNFR